MKLSKAEIAVVRVLAASENYHSSYEIASDAGISRRMVRMVMPAVRKVLAANGIALESVPNKGYRISRMDADTRKALFDLISEDEKITLPIPDGLISRQNFIMRRLIRSSGYIRLDDIAEEMGLSRSAVSGLMKNIRGIIQKYDLVIEQKPRFGVRIKGSEMNCRHLLNDFNFTALSDASMFYDWLDTAVKNTDSLENSILEVLNQHRILFTDIALCDLLLGIGIQIERVSGGHQISSYADCSELAGTAEMQAAEEITDLIEKQHLCTMNRHETDSLAAAIACKRSVQCVHSVSLETEQLAKKIMDRIKDETGVDYRESKQSDLISRCIAQLQLQLKYNEKIRTEMWDSAFVRFPLAYVHAQTAASIISGRSGRQPGVSQTVYLTEMFQTMMESMAINSFFLVYADERGIPGASYYFTVNAFCLMVSRMFIGRLNDRKGFVFIAVPGLLMSALALVLIGHAGSLWHVLAIAVINSLGYGAVQPSLSGLTMKCVPPERRGSASSTNCIAQDTATLLGPAICGYVAARLGYVPMMWTVMAFPVLVGVALVIIFRRQLDDIETRFMKAEYSD